MLEKYKPDFPKSQFQSFLKEEDDKNLSKMISKMSEEQELDIELKSNPEFGKLYYGRAKKEIGDIKLDPKYFRAGSVVSGKEKEAAEAILAAFMQNAEIKKYIASGKLEFVNPEKFKSITRRPEFSVEYDKAAQVGKVTVL